MMASTCLASKTINSGVGVVSVLIGTEVVAMPWARGERLGRYWWRIGPAHRLRGFCSSLDSALLNSATWLHSRCPIWCQCARPWWCGRLPALA